MKDHQRYMAIVHPMKPRMKNQTAYSLIPGVWIVPIVISIPSAYFASETTYPHISSQSHKTFCAQVWPVGSPALLPLLLHLRPGVRRARGRHGLVLRQALAGAVVQERVWLPDRADLEAAAQAQRMVVVLILVLAAYVLCWAPYYVFTLVPGLPFHTDLQEQELPGGLLHYRVRRHEQRVINTLCFVSVRDNAKCMRTVTRLLWKSVKCAAERRRMSTPRLYA